MLMYLLLPIYLYSFIIIILHLSLFFIHFIYLNSFIIIINIIII